MRNEAKLMAMRYLIATIFWGTLASAAWAQGEEINGTIESVLAGDRLLLRTGEEITTEVKLFGIDAPPSLSSTGPVSVSAMEELLPLGTQITCQQTPKDIHHGISASCFDTNGQDLAAHQLVIGMASVNRRAVIGSNLESSYQKLEQAALSNRLGIWAVLPTKKGGWDHLYDNRWLLTALVGLIAAMIAFANTHITVRAADRRHEDEKSREQARRSKEAEGLSEMIRYSVHRFQITALDTIEFIEDWLDEHQEPISSTAINDVFRKVPDHFEYPAKLADIWRHADLLPSDMFVSLQSYEFRREYLNDTLANLHSLNGRDLVSQPDLFLQRLKEVNAALWKVRKYGEGTRNSAIAYVEELQNADRN